jgi:hypothetical protein
MKYELAVNIICNDQATLDLVKASLPDKTDSRVWGVQYEPVTEEINNDGYKTSTAMIRFHNSTDRDDISDIITALQGMFTTCEIGTWIRLLICHHDPATELKPCEVETIFEVVP